MWEKCFICQTVNKKEDTKCPAKNPVVTDGGRKAYTTFLTSVSDFRAIGDLPHWLPFGEEMTADLMMDNMATWHKTCRQMFAKDKLLRAQRRATIEMHSTTSDATDMPRSKRQRIDNKCCIFCQKDGDLHDFLTLEADTNVRQMVTALGEDEIQARIAGGDLIAIDAKYHKNCLTALYNRYRGHVREQKRKDVEIFDNNERMSESRAYVELFEFIYDSVGKGTLLFKLCELHSLISERLKQLGINKQVHKTRLKERIVAHFQNCRSEFDGRNTIIIFEECIRNLLSLS